MQGLSLLPLLAGKTTGWRQSFMAEYFSENAMPWLVGMTYKAVRTDTHKYIHWVNRGGVDGMIDELYDLTKDPYELKNVIGSRAYAGVRARSCTRSWPSWWRSRWGCRPRYLFVVALGLDPRAQVRPALRRLS